MFKLIPLLFILLNPISFTPAVASAAGPTQACVQVDQENHYYGKDDIYVYFYEGKDAAAFVSYFEKLYQSAAPSPISTVHVIYDKSDDSVAFFLYGPDNCIVHIADSYTTGNARELISAVGLSSPVGPNYFQQPGAPGSIPGRH